MTKKLEFIIISALLCLFFYIKYQAEGLAYVDTDNYMHALRTIDFMQNPSLFERRFTLTNYPFGETSHWTRLMDILMSLTALPFLSFESIRDSVFDGSFFLVPLVSLGLLYILHKFGTQTLDFKSRLALYLLLLVQSQFMIVFKYNRPDHHAVIIFLAALLFYLCHNFTQQQTPRTIKQLAFVTALSLWLTIEGFILYLIILTFLYLGHIIFHYSIKNLQNFALTYLLFITIFLVLNPPLEGYLFFDNERLSILHVCIAAYIALILHLASYLKTKPQQFIFFILAAVTCLTGLKLSNMFSSPLAPQIAEAFTNRISEMRHGTTLYYLNYPLLGLLFLALNQRISRELRILLICFLCPYLFLSFWAMRFLAYADLFATLAIVLWLNQKDFKKISFIMVTFLLCTTEFISFIIWTACKYDLTKPLEDETEINTAFFSHYTLPHGTVATEVFITPQILWHMHRPVIASPYHRNVEGILDNHHILFSTDETEIVNLIKKHNVGAILLPLKPDKNYYVDPPKNCHKLYGKMLACHNYPEWLKEDNKARPWGYVLLEVISEKLP